MSNQISILLAGEFPFEQTPLRTVLAADERYLVVTEISLVTSLLAVSKTLNPQLIIVDWSLRGGNLLDALVVINARPTPPRLLLFVKDSTVLSLFETVRSGALGFLVADENEQQIRNTIETVVRGELALSPLIARALSARLQRQIQHTQREEPLSEREKDVLHLRAQGFSDLEISQTLELNERTVRTHISTILSKLHLANRTQAALWGLQKGLFNTGPVALHFQRVRNFCRDLRGTLEGTLDGQHTFFVGGKAYAIYLEIAYPNYPFVLLLPMPYGTQDSLLEKFPHKFFRPSSYAKDGWVALDLTQMKSDELRYYLYQSWKLVAS